MKARQTLVFTTLTVSALLIGLVILVASTDTGRFYLARYGSHRIDNLSPEEVGRYVQQYIQAEHHVRSGSPQVLLVRSVTRNDVPNLGLGCLAEAVTIEEPPLMLVILKGDFDFSNMPGSASPAAKATWRPAYIAYIFDLWAAAPVALRSSRNGGSFRQALNDPTLPDEVSHEPTACPPSSSPKTLHYGDVAPTPPPPDGVK